jgi:pyruvate/2-oxoglutarate dehydrogenase complex dihydrolipoamide acyltransferase (E2) component
MANVDKQLEAQKAAESQQDAARAEAERRAAEAQAAAAASQPPAEKPRTEAGRAPIGEGGYLVAIAGARRHVLNRVEDLAWTQGVQRFQATEGRLPKDHDEFMKRIVQELGIDLGYKEEGQEFLYDPTPNEEHPWGTVYVVDAEAAPVQ